MQPCNVLFLCTGNSARSILAEAILEKTGMGRFRAFSAGSRPAGEVNPLAIELLREHGFATAHLRSKSWDEFAAENAPRLDLVITVCDSAAGESCPVWPGQPITAHWSVADPAAVQGSLDTKRRAFLNAYTVLSARIGLLTNLPMDSLDRLKLQDQVRAIAHDQTASPNAKSF
jgi:protein-tyrosine-phosphatase